MNILKLCFILLLSTFIKNSCSQQWDSCFAVDYTADQYGNPQPLFVKGSHINTLVFNGNMAPISHPEKFAGIEYIIYFGNDWDYTNAMIPKSWLKLKNLKGILLDNMTFEDSAIAAIHKIKPKLFLSNMAACFTQWIKTDKEGSYKLIFKKNTRIPYDFELETMAWKKTLNHGDSLYLLTYLLSKETEEYKDSRYPKIKLAASTWLHADEWLKEPPLDLLDSFLLKPNMDFRFVKAALKYLESPKNLDRLDKVCRKLLMGVQTDLIGIKLNYDDEIANAYYLEACSQCAFYQKYQKIGYLSKETIEQLDALKKMACP